MLQIFGQMMMMPISMATAGMNMMTGTLGGGRGDGRAGWNAALGRWLGGCCGSREGPRGGEARSLDSRGEAGWTAREGRSGSGNPGLASSYRSGSEPRRPATGYRSGSESQPSVDYRSGTESRPSREYRSGSESRPSSDYRPGSEPRSGSGSGSRYEKDCGCGKRSGGGGCGCGSEGTRNHGHYREERRMSDCSCCEDKHTLVRLVEYWVVNVRHCKAEPFPKDGHGYEAYTEDFGECDLETWLLGKWAYNKGIPETELKYLRIKVNRLGEWHTMDDCCERNGEGNREVDVLRDINETLKKYLGGQYGGPKESTQPAAS